MKELSLEEVRMETVQLLARATVDKKHPYRTMVVGTVSNGIANTRNVVLRKIVKHPLAVIFYTDYRSSKVKDLLTNPNISFLFWHPKQRIQLRATGKAILENQSDHTNQVWKNMPIEAKTSYLTTLSPGTVVGSPTSGLQESIFDHPKEQNANHFTIVTSQIEKLEYLKLDRTGHRRAQFDLKNGKWEGSWLVP